MAYRRQIGPNGPTGASIIRRGVVRCVAGDVRAARGSRAAVRPCCVFILRLCVGMYCGYPRR